MRLRSSFAAVLAALPLILACGSDCYDLCDDARDEGCRDFDHDSCYHGCVEQEDFSDVADDCDEEHETYVDCVADLDNICQSIPDPADEHGEEKCHDEWDDYQECWANYCEDHSGRDWCKPVAPVEPHP